MTSSTRTTDGRTESTGLGRRVANWIRTRLERPHALRPTSGGGVVMVLVSVAVSIASVGALESSMRIRWTVGTHYGPEYASTATVLAAFPIAVALAVGLFRAIGAVSERVAGIDGTRALYELAVLTVLLWLVFAQVVLVVANLW